ncbi:MAG: RrF2 family transcriptional regulator [candidate division NC10 bacterium]|nr:RrF2 family transcriptional regulator [candidate division NC10 bacterium]
MRVSAKGDYATRAMQELAMNYNRGPLPIEVIAERRHIPVRYLEQLLLILKRAGFLESKRGVKGGYYLAKPPSQITVGEIIRLMDGSPSPIFCVDPTTNHEKCPVETICGFQSVWDEVHQVVANIIDKTTLEDICHRAMLKIEPGAASYRI